MTDATHTRDSELRDILAEEIDRRETLHETTHDKASPLDRCFDAAMAALRRISSNQSRHELSEADVKRAFDTLWKFDKYPFEAIILAAISTPIPLTPSDEMVEAAYYAFDPANIWRTEINLRSVDRFEARMMRALQAALNLMGGKK